MSLILNSGFTIGPGVVLDAGYTPPPPGPTIVTDGLVLHYDFSNPVCYNGISGDLVPPNYAVTDLSTANNTGTIHISDYSLTWTNAGSASYITWGSRYYEDDYVGVTNQNTFTDFTMVLEPDFNGDGIRGLFGLGPDSSLRVYNQYWQLPNPGNGNDWSMDGTTYYVNGQSSDQLVAGWNILGGAKTNSNMAGSTPLRIGTSWYQDRGFQGKIALVLMYNRVLTEQEQLQNYSVLRARFGL
jgi:hypothetical protein